MESILELFILLAFGAVCAMIANSRGRSGLIWFFLGFIFNCLALVILLVLPNLDEEEQKEVRIQQRHRRLQEELRQERMKNQAFRGHAKARMDLHDVALGMDTREQGEPPAVELPAPPPTPAAPSIDEVAGDLPTEGWFTAIPGKEAEGPHSLQNLVDLMNSGEVTRRTLVWNADHDPEWLPIKDTPLREYLT